MLNHSLEVLPEVSVALIEGNRPPLKAFGAIISENDRISISVRNEQSEKAYSPFSRMLFGIRMLDFGCDIWLMS